MIIEPGTSVLVVDDDEVFRSRLARSLASWGYEVREARNVTEALALATEDEPERAVVDLRMPDGSGLDLVGRLMSLHPALRIVVLTGYGSIATALEAVRRGALDYLTKPADPERIVAALEARPLETTSVARSDDGGLQGTPSLARVEWEHVQRVLQDVGGNVSEAARRLGVHRRSLQRKLAKIPSLR